MIGNNFFRNVEIDKRLAAIQRIYSGKKQINLSNSCGILTCPIPIPTSSFSVALRTNSPQSPWNSNNCRRNRKQLELLQSPILKEFTLLDMSVVSLEDSNCKFVLFDLTWSPGIKSPPINKIKRPFINLVWYYLEILKYYKDLFPN